MKVYVVYVGIVADFIHIGHINLICKARKKGQIIVGVLTDKAVESYKRKPICPYKQRKKLIENIKGVYNTVPQKTLDYTYNLRKYKPDYLFHGDDWKRGIQKGTRKKAIEVLKEWNGKLIEPRYTKGISSSLIKELIISNWLKKPRKNKRIEKIMC